MQLRKIGFPPGVGQPSSRRQSPKGPKSWHMASYGSKVEPNLNINADSYQLTFSNWKQYKCSSEKKQQKPTNINMATLYQI